MNKKGNDANNNEKVQCDDLARFVTTNQSYQHIPSLAHDDSNVPVEKLWSDQVEEFFEEEEGEFQDEDEQDQVEEDDQSIDHDLDNVTTEAEEEDDQGVNVNAKAKEGVTNTGDVGVRMKKQGEQETTPTKERSVSKLSAAVSSPNPNPNSIKTLATVILTVEKTNDVPSARKNLPIVTKPPNNQPLKLAKENLNKLMIPKPVQTN